MKRLLLLVAAAFALAWPVSAQAVATTESFPFETYVFACNGDLIYLSGTLLVVTTETATASGGFVYSSHFQPQGIRGVDLATGTTYIGTGLTRDISVIAPSGGFTTTFVNQFHIQATAGAESYIVSEIFHITYNANGELRAYVDNFRFIC
jgi:hypothetical protein